MGRPPIHKPLTRKHHVCTWVNASGRTRGLYATARGQFVQARITGYSMKPRDLITHDWMCLGYLVQMIVMHWSPVWRLSGAPTLRRHQEGTSFGRNPRALIEARVGK